jgi:hypothetical protein
MAMIDAGIAARANALWAILLLPVALLVIQRGVIERGALLGGQVRRGVPKLQSAGEALDLSSREWLLTFIHPTP